MGIKRQGKINCELTADTTFEKDDIMIAVGKNDNLEKLAAR